MVSRSGLSEWTFSGTPRANPQVSTGQSGSYRSSVGLRFDQEGPK